MQHFGIGFRTHEMDHSNWKKIEQDWVLVCSGVNKEPPAPLGKTIQLVCCVDANLLHDTLTGRSVTAFLHFINTTPMDWFSKKQSTVETTICSSEFAVTRTCIEQMMDLCATLQWLGAQVNEKSYMFGDDKAVVKSSSMVHFKLHKQHNAVSFHQG